MLFYLLVIFVIVYMQHSDWTGEMPPVMSKTGHLLFFQDLHFAANFQFCDPLKSSYSLLLYHALVRCSDFLIFLPKYSACIEFNLIDFRSFIQFIVIILKFNPVSKNSHEISSKMSSTNFICVHSIPWSKSFIKILNNNRQNAVSYGAHMMWPSSLTADYW